MGNLSRLTNRRTAISTRTWTTWRLMQQKSDPKLSRYLSRPIANSPHSSTMRRDMINRWHRHQTFDLSSSKCRKTPDDFRAPIQSRWPSPTIASHVFTLHCFIWLRSTVPTPLSHSSTPPRSLSPKTFSFLFSSLPLLVHLHTSSFSLMHYYWTQSLNHHPPARKRQEKMPGE